MSQQQVMMGTLLSGEVVIQRLNPHDHDVESIHLVEGLGKITSSGAGFIATQVEFENYIGLAHCVQVKKDSGRVFFGKRYVNKEKTKIRLGLSKFTYEKPVPTKFLSMILLLAKEVVERPTYVLISSWYGPLAPPEPWDPKATAESKDFWDNHALTYEGNEWSLVKGTKTKNCPW